MLEIEPWLESPTEKEERRVAEKKLPKKKEETCVKKKKILETQETEEQEEVIKESHVEECKSKLEKMPHDVGYKPKRSWVVT